MVSVLYYSSIKFPVSKTDYDRIEKKNIIYINVLNYENSLVYPLVWLYGW